MAIEASYVDTSALLRVLYRIPGQSPFDEPDAVLTSSEVTHVELALAVDRRRLAGEIDAATARTLRRDAENLLTALNLFPVSDEVLRHALEPFPTAVSLRTALHVATAQLVLREVDEVSFWTWSDLDAAAAMARRLKVRGHPARA